MSDFKLNPKKIKKGDIFSETSFYTSNGSGSYNINGGATNMGISDLYAKENFHSADQYESEEKHSRTHIIEEVLMKHPYTAMTVNFNKKLTEKELEKQIESIYPNAGGKIKSKADFVKDVRNLIDLKGEERTMRGYHQGHFDTHQRLRFIDMDQPYEVKNDYNTQTRLVDVRTLNWVICKGTKYIVK